MQFLGHTENGGRTSLRSDPSRLSFIHRSRTERSGPENIIRVIYGPMIDTHKGLVHDVDVSKFDKTLPIREVLTSLGPSSHKTIWLQVSAPCEGSHP